MDQPSTSNVLVGIAGESPPATSAAQASTALQICLSSRVLPVLDDTEADTPSGGKMDFVESVVDRGIALAFATSSAAGLKVVTSTTATRSLRRSLRPPGWDGRRSGEAAYCSLAVSTRHEP
jgi:hypothetical protein